MPGPVSSFLGLQTSLRGLMAQQRALDVTGHNIANAGTVGYTRQSVEMAPMTSLQIQAGAVSGGAGALLGQGVEVEAYRRMRDDFLDLQFRAQNMTLGDRQTLAEGLGRAEDALAEPSDGGINALLERFWDSWHDLASHPADEPTKQALIESAKALTQGLRDVDTRLGTLIDTADRQYDHLVTSAQSPILAAGREINDLNVSIRNALSAGRQPNELLDRRDLLLDQLSQLGRVSTSDTDGDGALTVRFGDAAAPLVDADTGVVTWPQALTAPGGTLGALLGQQTVIAGYRTALDDLAAKLHDDVNAVHNGGLGVDFFTGTTASTISVAVTTATLRASTTGQPGANDIARGIGALRNGDIDGLYTTFVRRVGADVQTAGRGRDSAQALLDTVDARRTSVTGVSFDEEMTNMVRYQRAYQASARAMSTVDEMLDTLINRTGRVGL